VDLGLEETYIEVVAPDLPIVDVAAPEPSSLVVVAVEGPPGPQGPIGPSGTAGDFIQIQNMIDNSISTHVADPEPHPAYDVDMPSLVLIFENGLI
jgi:hypothetical protein